MKNFLKNIGFDLNELNIYIMLLYPPLILLVYWYFLNAGQLGNIIPSIKTDGLFSLYSYMFQFACFSVIAFFLPFFYLKFYMKQPLSVFGFSAGNKKMGWLIVVISLPLIVVPLSLSTALTTNHHTQYPLARILFIRHDLIFIYELFYIIFYYIAWEFFFRGFLLFGLKDRFGSFNAILIQTISSALIHIGKPEGEAISSVVGGIIFGVIALRTNSIWYAFILHASLGVLTDLFIIYLKGN